MSENRSYRVLIYSLFLLSGVSGLIYQIVWTRLLVLVFGNTMLATSTVLSAFMGGLAAGSYVLGKYIDQKPRSLIRVYAVLEAGVGIFALLFPLVLDAGTPLYMWLYKGAATNIVTLNLVRFFVCFLIIGIPTFLMGGTLPVLIKRFTSVESKIGFETGFLYGLNTIGAVLGTFACGYFLLRELGMQHTTWVAVAINLGVALIAWMLGKNPHEAVASRVEEPAETESTSFAKSPLAVKMVLLSIGISGYCALAYEVFWTRMLNLFLHNNIYSFTAILGTFLIGIALGSLLYARFLSNSRSPVKLFVGLQIGIGAISYATPFLFKLFHSSLYDNFDETLTLAKTALIMIGPTVMMGIAVPLAIQICRKGTNREGTSVGTVYAVNTVGAIFGAFTAGFIILPELGLLYGVLLVASLNFVGALLPLFALSAPARRPVWAIVFGVAIASLVFSAPKDIFKSLFQNSHPHADIVYYKEGEVANVLVYDFNKLGYKDFHLNAVNEASSRLWHVQLFKLLGLLPTVVHDDPDDALMIAFGAGMSAGATVTNVKSLDVVDLNPDIRGIAESYTRENLDVYHQPNFHQVVNDGRNALLLDPKQYSLIISDATNPKMFDSWTLYSQEFYKLVQSRLKPGGIFCQWALIPLPADAIKVILNTFRSVFPHMSVWVIHGSSQFLMLGTPDRLDIDYNELSKRLDPLYKKGGLAEFGVDTPEKFLSFFSLGEDSVAKMLAGFDRVSTDDLPYAQFIIEQDRAGNDNCVDLIRYQESIRNYIDPKSVLPDSFNLKMDAYEDMGRRLSLGFLTGDQSKFAEAAVVAADAGLTDANIAHHLNACPEKIRHFEKYLSRVPEDGTVRNSLGLFYMNSGRYDDAKRELELAIAEKPEHSYARVNLIRTELEAGEYDAAAIHLRGLEASPEGKGVLTVLPRLANKLQIHRLAAAYPDSIEIQIGLAADYYNDGEILKAVQLLRRELEKSPDHKHLLMNYAMLCERHGYVVEAARAFSKLVAMTPGDPALTAKKNDMNKLASDASALRAWENSRIVIPEIESFDEDEPSGHPKSCDEALALWNDTDLDGNVSRENLERAANLYVKSTETNPDEIHAYVDAATIFEMLGELDRAARLWETAARFRSDLPFITLNAQRVRALASLATTDSGCPRAAVMQQIAQTYTGLGFPEQTLNYLRQASIECPTDAQLLLSLAMTCRDNGLFAESRSVANRILEQNPEFTSAKDLLASLPAPSQN